MEGIPGPGPEAGSLEGEHRGDHRVERPLARPAGCFLDLGAETEVLEFGESLASQLPPVVQEERTTPETMIVLGDLGGLDGLPRAGREMADAPLAGVDGFERVHDGGAEIWSGRVFRRPLVRLVNIVCWCINRYRHRVSS